MVVDSAQWGHDKSVIKPLSKWVAFGLRVVLGFRYHRTTGDELELKDSILNAFARELELGGTLTLDQQLEVMTDLVNALYITLGK
jgi:hypothetical protein